MKAGPFDIARRCRATHAAGPNPDGRSNGDVVRPWVNAQDITGRPSGLWIIDFGVDMPVEEAALYEAPFEYVRAHVVRSGGGRGARPIATSGGSMLSPFEACGPALQP